MIVSASEDHTVFLGPLTRPKLCPAEDCFYLGHCWEKAATFSENQQSLVSGFLTSSARSPLKKAKLEINPQITMLKL